MCPLFFLCFFLFCFHLLLLFCRLPEAFDRTSESELLQQQIPIFFQGIKFRSCNQFSEIVEADPN